MTTNHESSATLLQAIAEYPALSDKEIVAMVLAQAARARRRLALVGLISALIALSSRVLDLDRLLFSGATVAALILGTILLVKVLIVYWMADLPDARTVQDQVKHWPPRLWHLSPRQEQGLLRLAQQHVELRPHVARWVESGHPLRNAQSNTVEAWLNAVNKESEAESAAQELRALRQQVLKTAGKAAQQPDPLTLGQR